MRHGLARRARARWTVAFAAIVTAPLFATGCDLRNELVAPETPGVIDPEAVAGPTGASGLRIGALGALKLQTGSGETIWQLGGLLADEWRSASTSSATNEIDRRAVSPSNPSLTIAYNGLQQARGNFIDAIRAMRQYRPDYTNQIGELYMGLGFIEMQLAESFCNGIPFGTSLNGAPIYGAPNPNTAVLALASAHLDTAISYLDPAIAYQRTTDTADVNVNARVRPGALVIRARILMDRGQFAAAATAVSSVVTGYQYTLTFSTASGLNGNWNLNNSLSQYSLGDSADANGQIANALPFVSAKDVRVPNASANRAGIDGVTPLFTQSIWANNGQIPLASGIDARLIEAEAKLQAQDLAGMTATLNALRTTAQTMGTFRPATLTALAQPASQAAAVGVFFREKAFWTFGRGQRLGDLRRLVRQYGSTATSVGPSGTYLKGGTYGVDLNFPIPDAERANPLFTGCLDRAP